MTTPDPNWKPQSLGVDLTVIERLTAAAQTPRVPGATRQIVLVPIGYEKQEIPALHELPMPDHIRQNAVVIELASFIAYVKQFKTHTTRIFGSNRVGGASFKALLDYHEGGKEAKPGRCMHAVDYSPEYSDEFAGWLAQNGKLLSQEAFLDHLRKWGFVVTSHTEADLIEMASSLELKMNGQFASRIERTLGGRQLTWNETVEGSGQSQGQQVKVPDHLTLKLPIFLGGREYEVKVELLYRVQGGRLSIAWEMQRIQKVIFDAVKDLVKDVEADTGISVFIGHA